jgi:hypothetical protein
MNTYVISSLRKAELGALRPFNSSLDSSKLFSKAPSTINFTTKFSEDNDHLFIFSGEKVALKFFYLEEKQFFDLCTVNVLNLRRMKIMLSLTEGIGILGRGGPLNYISSEIAPLIGNSLFGSSTIFEIRRFNDREMQWKIWNGKLLGITFEPPDIESISVEGEEAESKIRELRLYPSETHRIRKIKAYNEDFKRKIIIERDGKIKISLWPQKVHTSEFEEETVFSEFSEKIIEFYKYVEGALGESS